MALGIESLETLQKQSQAQKQGPVRRRQDRLRSLVTAVDVRMAVLLAATTILGGTVLLMLPGRPTPTLAGLKQIPLSALAQLKLRLGADGRPDPTPGPGPVGTLTRSLTAAQLNSGPGTLRFEVGTQYYFRLKEKPKAGPDHWLGGSNEYTVQLKRTSGPLWQVASIKLIPPPHVQGQG
jgi:hypothetical protein